MSWFSSTPKGLEGWNEVKEQVRREHPEWRLKKVLLEAKKRYRRK